MTASHPEGPDDRLHDLERQLRRAQRGAVIGFGILATLLLMGQQPIQMHQESVGFTLLDTEGRTRGQFAVTEQDEPTLRLIGPDGVIGFALTLKSDGQPELVMFDSLGTARSLLGVREGGAQLLFLDRAGHVRATVGVARDGSAGLVVNDTTGARRGFLTALPAGGSGMLLRDDSGRVVFSAP